MLDAQQTGPALVPAIAAYDGDTPAGNRSHIRKRARLILTNPDMLHVGILPYHTQWAEFLGGLRWVVVDEMHTYRGVFGSHVANVLRRLQRICRHYGSEPRFICTSATIANPAQLAERLVEQPVTLVDQSGAPQGEKHVILVNPPLIDPEKGIRRAADGHLEARRRRFHHFTTHFLGVGRRPHQDDPAPQLRLADPLVTQRRMISSLTRSKHEADRAEQHDYTTGRQQSKQNGDQNQQHRRPDAAPEQLPDDAAPRRHQWPVVVPLGLQNQRGRRNDHQQQPGIGRKRNRCHRAAESPPHIPGRAPDAPARKPAPPARHPRTGAPA